MPVEPAAAVARERGQHYETRVILAGGPIDRRVRLALEAYLNHRGVPGDSVILLHGIDIYV